MPQPEIVDGHIVQLPRSPDAEQFWSKVAAEAGLEGGVPAIIAAIFLAGAEPMAQRVLSAIRPMIGPLLSVQRQ